MAFELNYLNKFEIDTKGDTDPTNVDDANFSPLAAGITQTTPALNETSDQTAYYDGQGFDSTDITGKRLSIAFAGNRVRGDAAQDFIVSKFLALGDDVKTLFRWTMTDGSVVIGECSITAIVPSGGNANAKQTLSFTIQFNNKPQFTAGTDNGGSNGGNTSSNDTAGKAVVGENTAE
ncbi:phage tail tube protein [Ligilactobacillus acidipiscis]|uniref:phage tail tube protein n=1 Tax=Ligilactobacillus acidipiscis TaxID=89059 RepID=UPI0023F79062|nr:capsid protein [Ligilactobacillus acidipiscis]WEV56130.1 capsid protein [Ligilactobacillus acidipiscis]